MRRLTAPETAGNWRAALRHPLAVRAQQSGRRQWERLRQGDLRTTTAAAVLVLLVCAGLSFATASRLPVASAATDPATESTRVAAQPAPTGPIRMLDGKPRSELCEEQTWPYIDRRCLTRSAEPATSGQGTSATTAANEPAADAKPPVRAAAVAPAELPAAKESPKPQAAEQAVPESAPRPTESAAQSWPAVPPPLPAYRDRQDPRLDPRLADPRFVDPRLGPQGDPRFDPRFAQASPDFVEPSRRELRRARALERRARRYSRRHGIIIGRLHMPF